MLSMKGISATADSAANTALTKTISGVEGYSHYLYAFNVAISGAAVSTSITISLKDDTTTIFKTFIGVGAPIGEVRSYCFDFPIMITPGNDLTLYVTAGGASVVTTGNLIYVTQ